MTSGRENSTPASILVGESAHGPESAAPALPPFLEPEDEEAARGTTAAGAMALVVSPAGIVLHLRDEKDWIPHPGCWSLFGGAVEEGESAVEALRRELEEEIGLVDFEARPLWRVVDRGGDGRLLTVFEVRTPVAPEDLVLNEGQGLAAFEREEALRLKLSPFCRKILEATPIPV
ncbi:NUDIX domain-containing protein [Kineosporia sp. J2-2]|uniref:NUDIX domain-containing protein n=1 Tax=Kineosporia corallincola TaxID=2835133 RepID=A0ABS5TR51_9ACTN|nr:NUDIX domain-containing protein [Kineosporia corallincola]MBT0773246.1 NUDIX domain-containing protein [Kineosporia corallincola]